jgi:hypothetical protein
MALEKEVLRMSERIRELEREIGKDSDEEK